MRPRPNQTGCLARQRTHYHRVMDLLKPLFALLAIVNPIGVVPFFIHFTDRKSVV